MTYILSRYHSATAAWSPHCVCERTRKMRVLVSVYISWSCFLRFINTVFGVAGQKQTAKVCLFTDLEAADEALSCDPNKEISSTQEWTAAYLGSIYVIVKNPKMDFTKSNSWGPVPRQNLKNIVTKSSLFYGEELQCQKKCNRCSLTGRNSSDFEGCHFQHWGTSCLLYTSPSPRD